MSLSFSLLYNYLERFLLGNIVALGDDAWVETFRDIAFGLLEQFTDKEHNRGGTVTGNLILGGSRLGNHGGSWMLNLLMMNMSVYVL